ncbi:hypothetical protein FHS94_003812 [Sphingomonas aerophila]|uniref:Uncharacterized protein n=1 Tax=Sphingomonas aerophila TaxID=1344948 RepID=A0A7W9BGR6_9SPHN|nr:hypothetical protein [Sphingomonas aerophila]
MHDADTSAVQNGLKTGLACVRAITADTEGGEIVSAENAATRNRPSLDQVLASNVPYARATPIPSRLFRAIVR